MSVNNTLGASSTDISDIDYLGALSTLGGSAKAGQQAMDIANQLYPQAPEADPWEAAFRFFAKMGEVASVPGSTAFGAAVGSMGAPLDYLIKTKANATDTNRSRLQAGLQIAPSLKPDVVKTTSTTKVVSSEQLRVMFPDEEIVDGLYNLTEGSDGSIKIGKVGGAGSTTTINNNGSGKKFGEILGSNAAKDFSNMMEASRGAGDSLNNYRQIFSFLSDPNFETGQFANAILPLQQIASQFGLEMFGVNDTMTKEAFQAKANELVLQSVSQMKGALSDKELGFLQSVVPNLSNSTKGNRLLVILQMQQLEKAKAFSPFVSEWRATNSFEDEKDYRDMMSAWRNQDLVKVNPYEYVKDLSKEDERRLIESSVAQNNLNMNDVFDDDGVYINGSLPREDEDRIIAELERKYNLSYVQSTFSRVRWD